MSNALAINAKQAPTLIVDTLNAGLVPFLTGSPGIGKSDVIRAIAQERDLKVIDVRLSQCDQTDLNGFPNVNPTTGKSTYLPMDTFPTEGDSLPIKVPAETDSTGAVTKPAEYYKGWLVFLDEFNSAPMAVQAAAYKLVLDRMVGLHNLHENVEMVAAGNLASDRAITNRISTAMQSRMIHLELALSKDIWMEWADTADLDFRVKSFINFKPELLHKFNPDHQDKTFACPRTWEFVSKIIKGMPVLDASKIPLLAGTISEGVGREFYGFCQIFQKLPALADIVAKPEGIAVPTEPSVNYAITGMIGSNMDHTNVGPLMKFVNRLSVEFQVITIRSAVKKNPGLISSPEITNWININSLEML